MSATMARQAGRVQLEQSNLCLALNMSKLAIGMFSHTTIHKTQYLTWIPCAEVRNEKKRGVELPGHKNLNAVMVRHPAMLL